MYALAKITTTEMRTTTKGDTMKKLFVRIRSWFAQFEMSSEDYVDTTNIFGINTK